MLYVNLNNNGTSSLNIFVKTTSLLFGALCTVHALHKELTTLFGALCTVHALHNELTSLFGALCTVMHYIKNLLLFLEHCVR